MSETRNLILTTVQGMDFDYVAPFIFSLKRTGYRGRLIIFASAMKGDAVAQLERHGATVIPFRFFHKRLQKTLMWPWPCWRKFFAADTAPALKEKFAHAVLPFFYRRHLLHLQFLREHHGEFDRIFLTDARDVYFQTNPFLWKPNDGLHFFLEEPANTIRTGRLQKNWTENQFGRHDAGAHLDQVISCAGTVFGDAAGMLDYLTKMVTLTTQSRRLRKIVQDDQGIHNYMLRENLLPRVSIHENRRSAVLTAGIMRMTDFQMNELGELLDEGGNVIPVLHQYDRLPELKKHLLTRLPP
jgi:hypothetical protein